LLGGNVHDDALERLVHDDLTGETALGKLGWVGLGLHLEFHAGGQWIVTSHVRATAVEPSATGAPC